MLAADDEEAACSLKRGPVISDGGRKAACDYQQNTKDRYHRESPWLDANRPTVFSYNRKELIPLAGDAGRYQSTYAP